jgi:hypothetical protein
MNMHFAYLAQDTLIDPEEDDGCDTDGWESAIADQFATGSRNADICSLSRFVPRVLYRLNLSWYKCASSPGGRNARKAVFNSATDHPIKETAEVPSAIAVTSMSCGILNPLNDSRLPKRL